MPKTLKKTAEFYLPTASNMANGMRLLGIRRSCAILFLLVLGCSTVQAAEKIISADEAYELSVKNELTVIDIRSPREWLETGVPKGARAITMHNPAGIQAFLAAVRAAVANDMSRPIALICAVGGRSRWARGFLTENGFSRVSDISEGMFGRGKDKPGWLKRGLPVNACSVTDSGGQVACAPR
jgi:rhodanese-related sulfurtransferase